MIGRKKHTPKFALVLVNRSSNLLSDFFYCKLLFCVELAEPMLGFSYPKPSTSNYLRDK